MRTHAKRLISLLLATVLVLTMGATVLAAEPEPLLRLQAQPETVALDEQIVVSVLAQAAGKVADGKLTIRYDAAALRYEGVEGGAAWPENADLSLFDRNAKSGEIVLAFAGVDGAGKGEVLRLTFRAVGAGETRVTLDSEGSYVTGAETAELKAETTVTVKSAASYQVIFKDGLTGETISEQTVSDGSAAEAPAAPDHGGYYFLGWDKAFDRVRENLTVTALYCTGEDGCPAHGFKDVNYKAYYHKGVDYAVEKGYFYGMTAASFGPNVPLTRAMMVAVLYRMAGRPAEQCVVPFQDVDKDDYYYDALVWACANKIAAGVSTRKFAPNEPVTREQMAAFLFRYARYAKLDVTTQGSLEQFKDAGSVSGYAVTPMLWAVENGLIYGVETDVLGPKATATRAQVATVAMRFDEAYLN